MMAGEKRLNKTNGVEIAAGDLAEALGGVLAKGDSAVNISGIAGLRGAGPGELSFVSDKKHAHIAAETRASALIVPQHVHLPTGCTTPVLIRVPHIEAALDRATALFAPPEPPPAEGVHPSAQVGRHVVLGENVSIGPCAVVEDHVHIGDNTTIGAQVFLGYRSIVGSNTRLCAGVKIRHRCRVGDRVVIHPGVVLGGDGFGYTLQGREHKKIPQIGIVVIEDDVEIGSNTTIDRARFGATRIGRGTKIDNLVMIAHNVQVGQHCIITGQCGIAGSTELGDYVMLGAQAGLIGHIRIGDKAMVGARSGVAKDVPPGAAVMGALAEPRQNAARSMIAAKKLPNLIRTVRALGKKVNQLAQAAEAGSLKPHKKDDRG